MRLITGDECGLLKECTISRSRPRPAGGTSDGASPNDPSAPPAWVLKSRWIDDDQIQARSNGVTSLAFLPGPSSPAGGDGVDEWGAEDGDDDALLRFRFAALRVDGSVETWEARRRGAASSSSTRRDDDGRPSFVREEEGGDVKGTAGEALSYRRSCRVPNVFAPKNKGGGEDEGGGGRDARPVGIGCAAPLQGRGPMAVACNSVGAIRVLSSPGDDSDSSSPPRLRVVARYDDHVSRPDGTSRNASGAKNTNNGASVTAFALGAGGERAALGGRDRETALIDVTTGKMTWKAKNLPPDRRTLLQHPVWTTAIKFLSQPWWRQDGGDASRGNDGGDGPILAVGTAYRQLRIYDVRAQRRPTSLTPDGVLPHRVTALCQIDDTSIAVGDSAGFVHSVDVRKMNAGVGRYVGSAGSVRCIVRHPTLPVLACVGLDRMLRTYDVRNRRSLGSPVYLKQRLNCVLMCMDGTKMPGESVEDVEDDLKRADLSEGALEEADYVQDYADSSSSSSDGGDDDDCEDDIDNSKQENTNFDDVEDNETSGSDMEDEDIDQDDNGRDNDDSESDSPSSSSSSDAGGTASSDEEQRNEAKHKQRKNPPVRGNKKRRT